MGREPQRITISHTWVISHFLKILGDVLPSAAYKSSCILKPFTHRQRFYYIFYYTCFGR